MQYFWVGDHKVCAVAAEEGRVWGGVSPLPHWSDVWRGAFPLNCVVSSQLILINALDFLTLAAQTESCWSQWVLIFSGIAVCAFKKPQTRNALSKHIVVQVGRLFAWRHVQPSVCCMPDDDKLSFLYNIQIHYEILFISFNVCYLNG